MIPDCPLDHIYSVGNAASDGERTALLNRRQRLEAQHIAGTITRIELLIDRGFQDEFKPLEAIIPKQSPDPLADSLRDS